VDYRVLWVEDGAKAEFRRLLGPLLLEPAIALEIAPNVTEAIAAAQRSEFEVIIIDIRLYPGDDAEWVSLFEKRGREYAQARLGVDLIHTLLGSESAAVRRPNLDWVKPAKIAILTVEFKEDILAAVKRFGVTAVFEKREEFEPRDQELPLSIYIVRERLRAQMRGVKLLYYV
jgi:DNA-binding NarL/FixJ family response regulator